MLAGIALTFFLDLDPCGVDQEMQRALCPPMWDVDDKSLLTATDTNGPFI